MQDPATTNRAIGCCNNRAQGLTSQFDPKLHVVVLTGKVAPLSQQSSIMNRGPGGDGALYTPAFKDGGHQRLVNSRTLQLIDPDIVLM